MKHALDTHYDKMRKVIEIELFELKTERCSKCGIEEIRTRIVSLAIPVGEVRDDLLPGQLRQIADFIELTRR